jgi:hypothetical protein
MSESKKCLSCERSEQEVPLVTLQFMGSNTWICPQCLPTLIHAPQKLAGKLPGAESMAGAQHKH